MTDPYLMLGPRRQASISVYWLPAPYQEAVKIMCGEVPWSNPLYTQVYPHTARNADLWKIGNDIFNSMKNYEGSEATVGHWQR